jgi:hypothetical protein
MPVIPTLRRLRQEDRELEASLSYIINEDLSFKKNPSRAPVAHTYNPSYSGG